MENNIILQLKNVSKIYDNQVSALKECSLIVEKGDMIAVQGVSGSGKSTLLNILGLLDMPSAGEFYLLGENTAGFTENRRAEIRNEQLGFVMQDFALIEDLSVMLNVRVPLAYKKKHIKHKEAEQRIQSVLERLGIGEKIHIPVSKLSGGQRQRVAIARALINHPAIILADEPTGALDTATSEEIMRLFCKLNEAGITIIVVTHDDAIAGRCRKRFYMRDGKLIDCSEEE